MRWKGSLQQLVLVAAVVLTAPTALLAQPDSIRIATFNASLSPNNEGELITRLTELDDTAALKVAEIIQLVRPDIILLNEFNFDSGGEAIALFQDNYLSAGQNGADPIVYPYVYIAPVNTGVASGFDLDNNGAIDNTPGDFGYANDAFGFGFFPGQFGMAVLSKLPIVDEDVRTFQKFLWRDLPGALLPDDPSTPAPADFYSAEELEVFRLSSKSHWDLPVQVGNKVVHLLASHPTPPVFDGPEDKNGTRNFDEIRFWKEYVTVRADFIVDDKGKRGGLRPRGAYFVILGDQNSDPNDGDSIPGAANQLLELGRINTKVAPASEGGPEAAVLQNADNDGHLSDPAFDTADFGEPPGNLRVDYVLPRRNMRILDAGVFWPPTDDPLSDLVNGDQASDHRLVYIDVQLPSGGAD